jgi:hypothetical protein
MVGISASRRRADAPTARDDALQHGAWLPGMGGMRVYAEVKQKNVTVLKLSVNVSKEKVYSKP